jgi:predicted DNA binding CopG/RHH family protein
MKKQDLREEREILRAYNKGEFRSIHPSKADLERYKQAARATFAKERRVNIRLSSPDLMAIQARAAEEGVPYQTLIASVLHRFVSGRLVEKPRPGRRRANGQLKGTSARTTRGNR